jgi:hypothetical protein
MAWILLVVVVVVALGVVAWMWARMRRTRQLQSRFGGEYDRAVRVSGDTKAAEAELRVREERREQFDIRPLSPDVQRRYSEQWRAVQALFVDQPVRAVDEADQLIGEAMRDRGYPVEDFDQRAADLSVDHPDVVENYRAAHEIALANSGQHAGTEDLRQAMVHYRSLFERLVGVDDPVAEARR